MQIWVIAELEHLLQGQTYILFLQYPVKADMSFKTQSPFDVKFIAERGNGKRTGFIYFF